MITCSKKYTDIPFAHRQQFHEGHCSLIHGHNWTIILTFQADKLDENGFVVDFGKLKYIKNWIDQNLDHACVLANTDPFFLEFKKSPYFKMYPVEDCSCEGIAKMLFREFNLLVLENENGRVKVCRVCVLEDQKNSAEYS